MVANYPWDGYSCWLLLIYLVNQNIVLVWPYCHNGLGRKGNVGHDDHILNFLSCDSKKEGKG